jgi:FkbM family methyltransferase
MATTNYWRPLGAAALLFVTYMRGFGHPAKIRIIRLIGRLFFPNGVPLIGQTGSQFNADPAQFIGWQILMNGSYEPETLKLGREILSAGGTYADVGANVGLHLACWGSLPGVTAIAVEPLPSNYLKLKTVATLNGVGLNLLYNVAVSDTPQLVLLEEIDDDNNGKTRVSVNPDRGENTRTTTVAALPLETIIQHASIQGIKLLKIDVEGYELPVLKSLNWNGPFRPENVIIEYSDYCARVEGLGRRTIFEFFEQAGYAAYEVNGRPMTIDATPAEDNAWFVDKRRCNANGR